MSLKETLESDLHDAMRNRDPVATSTLRMLIAAVRHEEVAGESARVLTDAEIVRILGKEAKNRSESATIYREAGRPELAAQEEAEAAIVATYLPAELSDSEVDALVSDAVAATGARSVKDMSQVMKALGPVIAGRADGRRVSERVRSRLGNPDR